jgi:alpha/beta superfamily hydrolase
VSNATEPLNNDRDAERVVGRPLYLDVSGTPAYAVLHAPPADVRRDTAVLLCPPFGFDEVCAYRIMREWAIRLASSGHPTLRLTYPSCGDSGGMPRDAGRLDAWTDSVSIAAKLLREQPETTSVIAIGLGLGGMLAYRAASRRAPISGLVLWGVPARGRQLIRQMKTMSRLEFPAFYRNLPEPEPLPAGELESGGFLLSSETVTALTALDLSQLELPGGLSRGALLLERDGTGPDDLLRDGLERHEIAVRVAEGDGYQAMTAHPQESVVPENVVAIVARWLGEGSNPPRANAGRVDDLYAGASSASVEIESGDGGYAVETAVTIDALSVRLSGVLTTPSRPGGRAAVVFLDSGAVRRIGPNRMWVEAARRSAARGVTTLRLDIEGVGDADGEVAPYAQAAALHDPKLTKQVSVALDFVIERTGMDGVILVGLCSGAYWALHTMLENPRAKGCVLVNARVFFYRVGLRASRDVRRVTEDPLSWERLRRNVTGARLAAARRWVLAAPSRRLALWRHGAEAGSYKQQVGEVVRRIGESGKPAALIFSAREPLDEELAQFGWLAEMQSWPASYIERIAVDDHTIRPIRSQRQLLDALDRSLQHVLVQTALHN